MPGCPQCSKAFKTSYGVNSHVWRVHTEAGKAFSPNRGFESGRVQWNKGHTKATPPAILKAAMKNKGNSSIGKCKDPDKERLRCLKNSEAAKKRGLGGYNPGAGRSKKFKVLDSFGNPTMLQSSFELRCCNILESLTINWFRPKHVIYDMNRKYFPDFYLPDQNIYFDTKNDYLFELDYSKITKVLEQTGINLFVLTERLITANFIRYLARVAQSVVAQS